MNDDAISLAMFWAGVLMVFTPIVSASIVIGVWWYSKRKREANAPRSAPTPGARVSSYEASSVKSEREM